MGTEALLERAPPQGEPIHAGAEPTAQDAAFAAGLAPLYARAGMPLGLGSDGGEDARGSERVRAATLRRVQRSHGNRFVQRMVANGRARATVIQRNCNCGTCERCQAAAAMNMQMPETGVLYPPATAVQPRIAGNGDAHQALPGDEIVPSASFGSPIDQPTRAMMSSHFGRGFDDVRVHTDHRAAGAAEALGAEAFTGGRDVYFAAGAYAPSSHEGRHLLAHELTHVVQQETGRMPTEVAQSHDGVVVGATHDPLELEAEWQADRFSNGGAPRGFEPGSLTPSAGPAVAQRFVQRQPAPHTGKTAEKPGVVSLTTYQGSKIAEAQLSDGETIEVELIENALPIGDYKITYLKTLKGRTATAAGHIGTFVWRFPRDPETQELVDRLEDSAEVHVRKSPQQRLGHAGEPDDLYPVNYKFIAGMGAGDRITGRHLFEWARARGHAQVVTNSTLRTIQEKPGIEDELVNDIYLLLVERLWGNAHDPETGSPEKDEFEGSPNARGNAVIELGMHWDQEVGRYLRKTLALFFEQEVVGAYNRTPPDASLELRPDVIRRIRNSPYAHTTTTGRWGESAQVGRRYGSMNIADIYKPGPWVGTVWFFLSDYPSWYYEISTNSFAAKDPFVAEVATEVAENTKLARELFPLMLKVGAFGLGMSASLAAIIASAALNELGEEGSREARGERHRSAWEILKSATVDVVLGHVMNRVFSGGTAAKESAAGSELVAGTAAKESAAGSEVVAAFEDRAAGAVRREVAATEAPQVAAELRAGRARAVENRALRDEGYVTEVDIVSEGQLHTYRKAKEGTWCRFTRRICYEPEEAGSEWDEIIAEREAMVPHGKRVSQETGMKETARIPGPVPLESSVSGILGEAGHAAEKAGRLPTKLKELFSAEDILRERDALLRGDITLRELVENYPPEGAAQVFFPTAQGGGRFIDHVYLEESTMFVVFRESKRYRQFSLGTRELVQLKKDVAFLSHPQFKGVRVEWRISGDVSEGTLAALNQIQSDTNGLFSFVLDPVVP